MNKENIFFNGSILGLGDSIAVMPLIEIYANINKNKKVFFSNKFYYLFYKEYKNIFFLKDDQDFFTKNNDLFLVYDDNVYSLNEMYNLAYTTTYLKKENNEIIKKELKNKRLPLQAQMADFLDLEITEEIKPKISFNPQPIFMDKMGINGYVCIATQTTVQGKYWNNTTGWKNIIDFLNIKGYSVICVDQHRNYGNLVYYNSIPNNCIDFTGLPLKDLVNIIYNCSFFVGLDSGLSWLAWALDKKVIQILGLTGKRIAFKNPYSILNKDVCNSCFEDESITGFSTDNPFNDFLMCPRHKNTKRMFECTKKINSNMVIEVINQVIKSNE
jgi:autotransporter strand-loop-strand O-heptosyltransferase